jgi:hypothetical protein
MKKVSLLSSILLISFLISCEKDNSADANMPIIKLSKNNVVGKSEYVDTFLITISAPQKIKSFIITKSINLVDDNTFGTNGKIVVTDAIGKTDYQYSFIYKYQPDEVDKLVGIFFTVTDDAGNSREADLTINTTVSGKELLMRYKWNLKTKFWVTANQDDTKDFDTDNIYIFNDDSTMSLDYGTKKDIYDGLNIYYRWELTNDEKTLTMKYYDVFNPNNVTSEVYAVQTLTRDKLVLDIGYDLSWLGYSTNEIFRYTMVPLPK